jgi:hypothetical protein
MTLLTWVLAALIGVALGLFGAGGSILTVPVFTLLLGYPPKEAIVMSLPVVGLAAAAGAMASLRRGTLRFAPAVALGSTTMIGAFAGAHLAARVDGRHQLRLLAVVMVGAAAAMWLRSRRPFRPGARRHSVLLGVIGLGVGLLTGVLGVGGGFLIVPALVVAGRLPMHEAASASLLIIALSTASGFSGYWGRVQVAWPVVIPFAAAAAAGVVAGGRLARRFSSERLQQAFSISLVVIAAYILLRG